MLKLKTKVQNVRNVILWLVLTFVAFTFCCNCFFKCIKVYKSMFFYLSGTFFEWMGVLWDSVTVQAPWMVSDTVKAPA